MHRGADRKVKGREWRGRWSGRGGHTIWTLGDDMGYIRVMAINACMDYDSAVL